MSINLLNDKQFNDYLTDITYQGDGIPKQPNYRGDFESADYVEQHRDEIIKGILNQYIKLRVREYAMNLEDEPAFVLVDKNRSDLPGWTKQTFERGENIYEFKGALMSSKLRDDIITVRDYLYDAAGQYVDKVIRTARETEKKPKIRYDYLKTSNEFSTFEKALVAAEHWHEIMAEELAKRNRAKDHLEKSLKDVKKIMDLPDGLTAYELTSPEALDFESDNMGHCVGRGGYDAGVKDGSKKIYSIRDAKGEPHATLEVRGNKVHQIKGKANKALIHKYVSATVQFINNMGLDVVNDLDKIHAIKQDGKIWDIFKLPKGFVVKGDLNLGEQKLTELPDLSTIVVKGAFNCSHNNLINLHGCPQSIAGGFDCSCNQLTSLEGGPQSVDGWFDCHDNQLTSLVGAPQTGNGSFICSKNQLIDLHGAPQNVNGNFVCNHNKLTSLDYAPRNVKWDFDCSYNELTSLKGAPQNVGASFNCSSNQLSSLEGASQTVKGDFFCSYNKLVSLQKGPQHVGGDFQCSGNLLTDLNGGPKYVGRCFYCNDNQLTNLSGAPYTVEDSFNCSNNKLTSLVGAPQKLIGFFKCSKNQLIDLRGAPKIVGTYFDCSYNKLVSLEGAPEYVGGEFDCSYNRLIDLRGAPQTESGGFNCSNNRLISLQGAPQIVNAGFCCSNNKLTSLEGSPESVSTYFDCANNQLTDLHGAPRYVGHVFTVADNPLKSLFGLPERIDGILRVGTLSNSAEIIAPEHLRNIISSIPLSQVEIMIENGRRLSVKENLLAGIEKLHQKQISEKSQEQSIVGNTGGSRV